MITTTSSTPTNASASLWPGNSAKLRLTQPVHPTTATASNLSASRPTKLGRWPYRRCRSLRSLGHLVRSQSVCLGRVYLTRPIVFVVGEAVLGRTLISGLAPMLSRRYPAASAARFLCLHGQAPSCGLPLDRCRISSRGRPVPRHQSLACATARRRARSDR
jgi:hypothetical protein